MCREPFCLSPFNCSVISVQVFDSCEFGFGCRKLRPPVLHRCAKDHAVIRINLSKNPRILPRQFLSASDATQTSQAQRSVKTKPIMKENWSYRFQIEFGTWSLFPSSTTRRLALPVPCCVHFLPPISVFQLFSNFTRTWFRTSNGKSFNCRL